MAGIVFGLCTLLSFLYELERLEVGLHYGLFLGLQYDLARGPVGFHFQNILALGATVFVIHLHSPVAPDEPPRSMASGGVKSCHADLGQRGKIRPAVSLDH